MSFVLKRNTSKQDSAIILFLDNNLLFGSVLHIFFVHNRPCCDIIPHCELLLAHLSWRHEMASHDRVSYR